MMPLRTLFWKKGGPDTVQREKKIKRKGKGSGVVSIIMEPEDRM